MICDEVVNLESHERMDFGQILALIHVQDHLSHDFDRVKMLDDADRRKLVVKRGL